MNISQKFMKFCEERLIPIGGAIANQRHLKSIRDGMIYTIPVTIFGGLVLIVANPPISNDVQATNFFLSLMVKWRDWATANKLAIQLPFRMTMGIMALFVAINVAYSLAKSYKMDCLSSSIVSAATFLIIAAPMNKDGLIPGNYIDAKGIFTAMIVGLLTVEITRFLKEKNITIRMPEGVPPAVTSSFDALIPLAVNVMLFYLLSLLVQKYSGMIIPQAIMKVLGPAINVIDSGPFIAFAAILSQLFWFVGIHGAAIVRAGILAPFMDSNIAANAEAMLHGQPLPHILTFPFWAFYIVLGGSGATLGLTLLYLRSRSNQLRTLGRIALLPGIFNINEPIIFGTPMVLNPIMLIPFVFVQAINTLIAFYATKLGFIRAAFVNVPWTTPAPIGAFLSTLDWKAPMLVFILLALDMVLYYPFFKIYEKHLLEQEGSE